MVLLVSQNLGDRKEAIIIQYRIIFGKHEIIM